MFNCNVSVCPPCMHKQKRHKKTSFVFPLEVELFHMHWYLHWYCHGFIAVDAEQWSVILVDHTGGVWSLWAAREVHVNYGIIS